MVKLDLLKTNIEDGHKPMISRACDGRVFLNAAPAEVMRQRTGKNVGTTDLGSGVFGSQGIEA